MTGLDIEAIRRRLDQYNQHTGTEAYYASAADALCKSVPLLLAEVERLTVEARNAEFEVVRLRGELAGANAEVGKLREWNDEIKAERDALAERCLVMESEIGQLTPERDDARAALSDALQVIADLRGETS